MHKLTRIVALLLVAVAVVLALVALNLGKREAAPVAAAPAAARETDGRGKLPAVVTAAIALPAGRPIPADALRLAHLASAPAGSFASVDAVAGSLPRVDIPAGATITSELLARGMAVRLKPGERALAVPVDELAGAGNRIAPGDYVDVFLSLKATPPGGPRGTATEDQARLLLSRLRVLAYGGQDLPSPAASTAPPADGKAVAAARTDNPPPRTAVLAVPVADVGKLLLGAQNGRLALALRHPVDAGRPDDALFPAPRAALAPLAGLDEAQRARLASPENRAFAGIDGAGLAGTAGAPQSAAHPRKGTGAAGLEIIRGTARSGAYSARHPSP
jgi:pilus assembly protein CpaB